MNEFRNRIEKLCVVERNIPTEHVLKVMLLAKLISVQQIARPEGETEEDRDEVDGSEEDVENDGQVEYHLEGSHLEKIERESRHVLNDATTILARLLAWLRTADSKEELPSTLALLQDAVSERRIGHITHPIRPQEVVSNCMLAPSVEWPRKPF